ncbi:hypothetical protein ABT025_06580 [Streptomyces sp. NPDC002809]|uniref:hypothetical protein n=1 Tax=Streptomyces sp. NPDC002809 TaxID=3154433 RepID=UPI003328FC8B
MIVSGDRRFPFVLAAAMAVRFKCMGEDGVDFEPYESFLSADETTEWFRAWTGNRELNGDDFRVFGQDGTGGYAAFWLVRPCRELAEQPIVFLGSEGETGVVAQEMGAFLWLLADGFGPWEAVASYEPESDLAPPPRPIATLQLSRSNSTQADVRRRRRSSRGPHRSFPTSTTPSWISAVEPDPTRPDPTRPDPPDPTPPDPTRPDPTRCARRDAWGEGIGLGTAVRPRLPGSMATGVNRGRSVVNEALLMEQADEAASRREWRSA